MNVEAQQPLQQQQHQIYNIALIPIESSVAATFTSIALENFSTHSDGYILGPHALPHVTLCQFSCMEEQLETIWNEINTSEFQHNHVIQFDGMYMNPGRDHHRDYIWSGLSTRRSVELVNMQTRIHSLLVEKQLTTLTATGGSYFPHLTLARVQWWSVDQLLKYPDRDIFEASYMFRGSIGLSDSLGVYRQVIYESTTEDGV